MNLRAMVEDEVRALHMRHPQVRCESRVEANTICSGEVALRSILVNLLDNAAKYAGDAPRVTIATARRDDRVQLSVRDDGPGIPAALHERIFDRYYHTGSGVGLGLYVARGMAERLGGTLTVESPSGGGTAFILSLPARVERSGAPGTTGCGPCDAEGPEGPTAPGPPAVERPPRAA